MADFILKSFLCLVLAHSAISIGAYLVNRITCEATHGTPCEQVWRPVE